MDDQFPVKGWSVNSQLHSVPDCQGIVKRAIVRRFEKVYHRQWFAETGPIHQVQFTIHRDQVTLLLDTSGPGLHKRGYRAHSNEAPIKETLAAGIVDLARVRGDSVVCDPMCGSGTLVIEAALKALNIAPGIRRRFAAQQWACFQDGTFERVRQEAVKQVRREAPFVAYASDLDEEAVKLTRENAAKAGVASRIRIKRGDVADFVPPESPCILLTNPPYGERLMDQAHAEELCRTLGRVLPQREGFGSYIISSQEGFEELFGRSAIRRRKLYNGMIRCTLYMYFSPKNHSRPDVES